MLRQSQKVGTSSCLLLILGKDENDNEKMASNGPLIPLPRNPIALLQRFPSAAPSPPDKSPSEHTINKKANNDKTQETKKHLPRTVSRLPYLTPSQNE